MPGEDLGTETKEMGEEKEIVLWGHRREDQCLGCEGGGGGRLLDWPNTCRLDRRQVGEAQISWTAARVVKLDVCCEGWGFELLGHHIPYCSLP